MTGVETGIMQRLNRGVINRAVSPTELLCKCRWSCTCPSPGIQKTDCIWRLTRGSTPRNPANYIQLGKILPRQSKQVCIKKSDFRPQKMNPTFPEMVAKHDKMGHMNFCRARPGSDHSTLAGQYRTAMSKVEMENHSELGNYDSGPEIAGVLSLEPDFLEEALQNGTKAPPRRRSS